MTDPSFAHGLIGITLDGRYRLDAVLGEGGMGSVFRATHVALDRRVAVKLLKPHLTSDEAALQRFAREARSTRKVESPHAVKILDFGVTPTRDYYMVLEYLDGRTVQRELEIDGRFAPARVAHVARQALAALATAHGHGLVHRDIKPDNLLLMRVGADPDYTKVLDFGVAKLMQGAAGDQLALTAAGMVFGTPEYMSPEQACGYALDGRSDLYSLAVTMFVMLTGRPLFEGSTAIEWLTHHVRTPAPRLADVKPELARAPGLAALDELVQRCLAKDRELRPATAAELSAQLAALAPVLAGGGKTSTSIAAAALAPTPRTPTRVSSYVEALRDPPPGLVSTGAPVVARVTRRSRGWIYAALAIAVVLLGGIGAAIAVRASDAGSPQVIEPAIAATASPSSPGAASQTAAAGAPRPIAVASPTAGVPQTAGAVGSAVAPVTPVASAQPAAPTPASPGVPSRAPRAPSPGVTAPNPLAPAAAGAASAIKQPPRPRPKPAAEPRPAPPASSGEADDHLKSAEDAFRTGNRLRQLAEADLALRAAPSSVRARFLLADALLKGGDLDRGCAYLRDLKGSSQARDRARAAGCPD